MPGLFSKVFKKDSTPKKAQNGAAPPPAKPRWTDAWQRTEVEPREVQELLHGCTAEIKSRALQLPFVLLPYRPASDPSAARTFVRNFFGSGIGNEPPMSGTKLATELRLAEPLVLCSVMKWCWSRLPGGVVTWDAYELFKEGEHDSNLAREAFSTFIPIGTADDARTKIIVDFFDLLATIAAHGKSNGFPGRKLSRYAGWWAFEHKDSQEGFDGGFKRWRAAADATSHLFFAYLRSLAPDPVQGALTLPRSLQALLEQTEYPPIGHNILQSDITKVVMIVDKVSPTPFALLRRAKNFEYRSDDQVLQAFSDFEDPVKLLTDECKRILQGIAAANDSSSSKVSTSLRDASWSRFEDIGFAETNDDHVNGGLLTENTLRAKRNDHFQGLRNAPASVSDMGRPTTPSWADFLSSGFADQQNSGPASLLPPDKQLPPISIRAASPQSQAEQRAQSDGAVGSGELASINPITLDDDVFWWVWITSLAGEETTARKAAFGRCALIETKLQGGTWLLMEEVVKGAKAEPAKHAYVAEKKSRFGLSKLLGGKSNKSTPTKKKDKASDGLSSPTAKKSIAPDQHARIQAAAAALSQRDNSSQADLQTAGAVTPERRGRTDENAQSRTTSVLTLQPVIMNEAAPAMKWANSYDKNEVRAKYLGDRFAGRGSSAIDLPSAETKDLASSRTESPIPPMTAPNADVPASTITNGAAPPQASTVARSQTTVTKKPVASRPVEPTPIITAPATPQKKDEVATYPRPMERIEPPARGSSIARPDQFMSGPEYSKQTTISQHADSGLATPEASPGGAKKLQKRGNVPGRFGSIFGRKKTDDEKPASPASVKAMPIPAGGSAVAAARAALEAKAQQTAPAPARQSVIAKRTSIGEATSPKSPATEGVSESTKEQWSPISPAQAAAIAAPAIIEPPVAEKTYEPSYTTDSHVDETESHVAEREFSRFDQGPLDDAPAYDASEQKDESSVSAVTDSPAISDEAAHVPPPDVRESMVSELNVVPTVAATQDAEKSEDTLTRNRALSNDRWAQIRKNAAERAERAAARQSEEQSRVTSNTEDDADTEGEETIESRVARIKARVAELTGNMEAPSQTRQH